MVKSKKAFIVVGSGFGDEGKGLVTDYLCSQAKEPIVIRFNGGQQAGHTVWLKSGKQHVFSNFGAGTFRGVPTYWSKYCTFCPGFFLEEFHLLKKSNPQFFIDGDCPITTHYDILYNRIIETFRGKNRHGSCGLGFGATVARHKQLRPTFTVNNLLNETVCQNRLAQIRKYYKGKIERETNFLFSVFNHDKEDENFLLISRKIRRLKSKHIFDITNPSDIMSKDSQWQTYIFEGSQGILLDPKYGNPPHVTKSRTTTRNALRLIHNNFHANDIDIQVFYITRAYHTRHGAGPFLQNTIPINLKKAKHETNVSNEFQGSFRIGDLNLDLLNYAIKSDQSFSKGIPKQLVITCLDQLPYNSIPVIIDKKKRVLSFEEIQIFVDCDELTNVRYSFSKFGEDLI